MPRRRGGVNAAFLQGEDPEADLMGATAKPTASPTTAAEAAPAGPPKAAAPVRSRRVSTAAPKAARAPAPPPPRPEKRWQRVNVYLEPKTQGHWMNRTRGRLLELDRGDIGVTEIVRLALDRLADELNVSELVAEYDQRYASQEGT